MRSAMGRRFRPARAVGAHTGVVLRTPAAARVSEQPPGSVEIPAMECALAQRDWRTAAAQVPESLRDPRELSRMISR